MPERILVVEDEIILQETLAYNLNRQGYEVDTAGDGSLAVAMARSRRPDLILLDIMLPGMDGFEVCRLLRQELTVPIIFLTARDDEIDRVVGFEIGGDDYISKPFSMRELIARVKARLRMSRLIREAVYAGNDPEQGTKAGAPADAALTFGSLRINPIRREVTLDGALLALKPKEFELIYYFARNKGRAVTREQILQQVWGYNYYGDSRTVDVHIRWLREKIENDPSNPERIITVWGAGYRFDG